MRGPQDEGRMPGPYRLRHVLRTIDHSGMRVPLHPKAISRVLGAAWLLRERRLGWWLGLVWRGISTGLLPLLLGTLALCGMVAALLVYERGAGFYMLTLTPVAMPLLAASATLLLAAGVAYRRMVAAATDLALRASRCPSCDYQLEAVADKVPDTAGDMPREEIERLVTCPECGTRWRTGRVGSSEPERPRVVVVPDGFERQAGGEASK